MYEGKMYDGRWSQNHTYKTGVPESDTPVLESRWSLVVSR